jgi:hypothetical protein
LDLEFGIEVLGKVPAHTALWCKSFHATTRTAISSPMSSGPTSSTSSHRTSR